MKKYFNKENIVIGLTIIIVFVEVFITKILHMATLLEFSGFILNLVPTVLAIFLLLQLIFNFKSFIKWIRGGIENGDGALQTKDLTTMAFVLLYIVLALANAIYGLPIDSTVLLITAAGAGVITGIDALQKVYGDKKNNSDKNNGSSEI